MPHKFGINSPPSVKHISRKAFFKHALELEYGIVVSPTVIPFEEFEIYKKDLPYYRNIWMEGVEICVWREKRSDAVSSGNGGKL